RTSGGPGALLQGPGGVANPDSVQATRNLFRRFDEAGRISFLTYDTSQQNLGFDVGGGEGIRFAVNGGLQFNQGALQDAYYRGAGVGFGRWRGGGGGSGFGGRDRCSPRQRSCWPWRSPPPAVPCSARTGTSRRVPPRRRPASRPTRPTPTRFSTRTAGR